MPLFYLLISQPWHLYLIQAIFGLAGSMAVPSWRILFTDHLDRGRTGYEWSLEDVGVGTAMATSAYLGALLAEKLGFEIVLIILAILGYLGTMLLVPISKDAKTLIQIRRENRWAKLKQKRQNIVPLKVDDRK